MRDSGMGRLWLGALSRCDGRPIGKAGDLLRAARLFGAADVHWRKARMSRFPPVLQRQHDDEVHAVKEQLGDNKFAGAWNEGQALDTERVYAIALTVKP
jgi:hypothetical protein